MLSDEISDIPLFTLNLFYMFFFIMKKNLSICSLSITILVMLVVKIVSLDMKLIIVIIAKVYCSAMQAKDILYKIEIIK